MKKIRYDAKLGRIWPDAEIEEAVDNFFRSDEDLIVVWVMSYSSTGRGST